jgi:hypothetical protein
MPKKVKKIIVIIFAFTLGCIITLSLTTNAESQLASESVGYDNTNSGSTKTTVKDAIDELYEKANSNSNCPSGYNCSKYKCKRATKLHTEICTNSSSNYCQGDGYSLNDTITYGSLGTKGTLTSGDAFDCDVNGDGVYDAETERFYYISDYYNTSTKTFNENYAVLIYYNNVSGGESSNTTFYLYDSSGSNNNGPVTAKAQLPTTSQWSNVSLLNTTRAITTQTDGASTSAGTLPTAFSYAGFAARLLTYKEVFTGCYDGSTGITSTKGLSSKCKYLMENTKYTNSSYADGTWLETSYASNSSQAWGVSTGYRYIYYHTINKTGFYAVRPAIEVLKSDIEY